MLIINNLWRTYVFIAFISIVSAFVIIYSEWHDLVSDTESELIYVNKIMSSSVESLLDKYEGILGLLGDSLLEMDALNGLNPDSKKLIGKFLKGHSELSGLSLANPSGQQRFTSYNHDISELPNLLNSPKTASAFKYALIKDHLVVGRTNNLNTLKQWLIPLHYRILDTEGKVAAILTTGLKLESTQTLWSSLNFPAHLIAASVRKDLYRQYLPKREYYTDKEKTFSKPISKEFIAHFEQKLIDLTSYDLASLRQSGKTLITQSLFSAKRVPTYTSISYDSTYESYTLIITPVSLLHKKMYQPIFRLLLILLLFNGVLFWLFKNNAQTQEHAKKILKHQAEHDSLTSLPNRRNLLNNYTKWKQNHNAHFYVIFIDLNNFKSINDLHGHTVGDNVLIEIANRINSFFPECFKVRQGGDEFIILCPQHITRDITQYCDNFLQKIHQSILVGDLEFVISASLGIAISPDDGNHIDVLLRKADMAMYDAKRHGNDIAIFSNELEQLEVQKALIEKELTHALSNKELFMVYQPQVDAKTKKMIGVEALIRWNNPELGFVSPDKFIPIAEATGLIIDIGVFVLEQSISQFLEFCKDIDKNQTLRLSINISVRQLMDKPFLTQIETLSKKLIGTNLTIALEVTESLFIEDLASVSNILNEIRQLGIEISLDDFGTGYSSLNVLKKLPINELKIDRSFVRDILTDDHDKELIQSIINLSKSLKIPVIAEGVEDLEQANLLLEFGCDLFQGYYFSKPLDISQLKTYINS
jgi:diguanylate cyclase (GGDEF)-like protein